MQRLYGGLIVVFACVSVNGRRTPIIAVFHHVKRYVCMVVDCCICLTFMSRLFELYGG